VHQWRCSSGLRTNSTLTSADLASHIKGVTAQSPTLTFNPHNWYYV